MFVFVTFFAFFDQVNNHQLLNYERRANICAIKIAIGRICKRCGEVK